MLVVVVEDAEVLARGLVEFVGLAAPGGEVRAARDPEALLAPGPAPDVVVCGPSVLAAYCGMLTDVPQGFPTLAVLSDPARVDFTAPLAAGIDVFWDFRGSPGSFAAALQAALTGQPWVSESVSGPMTSDLGAQLRRGLQAADFGLTAREGEILQLLATGMGNKEIAGQLFISQNTVKNHVRAVLDKLHADTRTQAVMIGVRVGLIDAGRG